MKKNMAGASKKIKTVEELESLLRAGEIGAVAHFIQTVNRNQIPRQELAQYANIANRVDLSRIGHRFLQPFVLSTKAGETATDFEKSEFAESLRGMGLISEAKDVLKGIDPDKQPAADLRMSFCLMTQWEYAEAIPYLRRYISKSDPKLYTYTIAQVNLAAALVIERKDEEALHLLEVLKTETLKAGHQLLYGNCLELLAQLYVLQGQCDLADQTLDEADASFAQARNRYSLYLRKWRAISRSLRAQEVHPELQKCRDVALQDRDWETLRECDLYIGFINRDEDLLRQVYFGTPYRSYRNRVLNLAGSEFITSSDYIWNQCRSEPVQEVFDLLNAKMDHSEVGLEAGQLMHRLLILLASDFYRPLSVTTLFSELFPDEHFMQAGSTNRIAQAIKRLRMWLEENGRPFSIEEMDGNYRLRAHSGVGLRVPLEKMQMSAQAVAWTQLKAKLKSDLFSRNDVVQTLNCSAASANRLLRWALSEGQSQAVGSGPQRKYRIAS